MLVAFVTGALSVRRRGRRPKCGFPTIGGTGSRTTRGTRGSAAAANPGEAGAERSRVTGYRGIRLLLRRAALDDDDANRAVEELHKGHAVVLVNLRDAEEAEPQLGQPAKAA
jgi:hypothetical protein